VSKHWKPGKTTVQLKAAVRPAARPSRIRRDPVPINVNVPARPQRPLNHREREMFLGIAGILIFATAIGAAVLMLAMFTVFRDDPAADARYAQFNQCYVAAGPNCVLDGGTIYVGGQRIEIAGLEAPKINDSKCDQEHDRGIQAATELALLLNSGPVTVDAPFRDQSGRVVRKVEVKGRDVALRMVDQDLAHQAGSGLLWCH
jgi:endonuclease YncB( thermonuclease family)